MKIGLSPGTALIRYALIFAVLVGAVLSYWASVSVQQLEVPNIRAVIRVQEFSPHQSDPQVVINDLARIAREERGDILVESVTLSGRTVYGAGKNADQWIQHGYRGLPGTPHLEFVDFSQLPHTDYRQAIELSGSAAFEKRVTEYLEARDIPIAFLENLHWEMLLRGSALGYLTWLLVGMCLAFCVIGVVLNSHADAVRRLHGYGVLRSGVYELRRAGGTTFWVLVAAVVGVTVVMLFWTSTAVVQQWLYHQLVFIGMSLVACIVGTFGTLVLLRQLSVTNMLAGKLPGKTVLTSMYVIRAGVCIVAVAMSIGLINHGTEWLKQRPERQIWETAQQTYAVGISGARSNEGFRKAEGIFGPKLRELSAQGTLIYKNFTPPSIMPVGGLDRPILTYNETAAKKSLQGELRRVVDNLRIGDQPILLQPDNLPSTVDIDAIRPDLTGLGAHPQWQVVTYPATGSRAFTWETGVNEWMNRAEAVDPVVIIYPNRHLFVSDRNLLAAVTKNNLLLTDLADYQRLQADPQVGSLVKSITPVSQQWAANHQTMGRTVWIYAGGLLIALLLCAVSALAVFSTWLKVFHQKMRAHYIHGVIPQVLIAAAITVEVLTAGILAGYLWDRGSLVRESMYGPIPGFLDPTMVAMLSIPSAAWWLAFILTIATSMPIMLVVLRNRSISQLVHTRR